MKLTAEMLPLIRACRGLSQNEFADYSGIPQARLSDIETGKISISDYYSGKLFLAIGKLKFDEKELNHIAELTELKK
ncbi:helix-turn-helix domain-containing protein [Bacillus altitudinis]|uniref:helix-turn-helix domain-containing protein n=1 Tax=Bacillus altitudinis TaxID=293387 RepID=UPI0021010E56|nr:helix-turn-helix transcriptional regulator [Bacillus altitudinis]UTV31683.1 helix-turn-helix transcriptional regulator [Bacillus altitudinis]